MHRFRAILAWFFLGVVWVPLGRPQPVAPLPAPARAEGASLISPYRAYSLRLTSFVPSPRVVAGVLLKARINGGPELRLLLDSGAEEITLDRKAATKSALLPVSDFLLVGAGESPTRAAMASLAEKVEVGPVAFANCPVDVVSGRIFGGIDGVIPMSLFGGFLVRLDLPSKTLSLVPYPNDTSARSTGFSVTVAHESMLLTKAVLDDAREGYVLLDTGAAYTGISPRVAQALRSSPVESLHMQGATGSVAGEMLTPGIRFRIAGQEFTPANPVTMDLTTISRYSGVEMIGVLGYPELRHAVLTVNYRDALVDIELKGGTGR